MTAKQEFYAMFCNSVPSTQQVKEFCDQHHSVQWRKRGSSNVEIRFNDHENWMDAEAFCSNYHNKVCKQLNDLMLASSSIVTHGELWKMTSAEFKQAVKRSIIQNASEQGELTTNEEYNQLLESSEKIQAQASQLASERKKLISQREQSESLSRRCLVNMQEASEILQQELSRMVISKDKIKEAIEILKRR